jgi:hypothetical protein
MSPGKLGIGMPFSGYAWMGGNITPARQSWTNPPTSTQLPFKAIMSGLKIIKADNQTHCCKPSNKP